MDKDIRSVQIDFSAQKIIVGVAGADGDTIYTEYFARADYLADFPARAADCDAIGWPPESA